MGRAGYTDDWDYDWWPHIRWRGQVASSIRGKRGQAFLRDLLAALDAMPEKKLIANDLERDGCVCAIGSLGQKRGVDMAHLDPEDTQTVAQVFDIAEPLVREIVYENDEAWIAPETPEQRWQRMRKWVEANIKADASA